MILLLNFSDISAQNDYKILVKNNKEQLQKQNVFVW